jgi:nucleotide sugar dehydrogenase
MKIGLIGAGRLGLAFALLCEQAGYEVIASDVRKTYISELKKGVLGTTEPGVHDLLWDAKNIEFTVDNKKVINECDIIFTLVATPSLETGDYDVSAVERVVKEIAESGREGKALVVGCTTNPGDCERFQDELDSWDVFYNPEFIAQGSIISDLRTADMVLIGGDEGKYRDELVKLYYNIQGPNKEPRVSFMSTTAAELVKLAVNCYLTTKISYANMVGEVMTLAGMEDEISSVLSAIGADRRIGNKFLNYGYGFGGPCLPRDNRAFAAYAKTLGIKYNLGETTDNFNDAHAKFLYDYVVSRNYKNLPYCFDYVAYKKGTDIIEESQQYRLCIDLLENGYEVYINDGYPVLTQIKNELYEKYYDRVKFEEPTEEVYKIEI